MNNTACSRQCTNQRHSTAPTTISSAKAAHQQTALATPEAGVALALDPYAAAHAAGVRGTLESRPLHRCAGRGRRISRPLPRHRRQGGGGLCMNLAPQIQQHHPQPPKSL